LYSELINELRARTRPIPSPHLLAPGAFLWLLVYVLVVGAFTSLVS